MSNSAFTVTGSATGTGTVTSIGLSSTDGLLTFTNSPITTSGSIAITVGIIPVANGGTALTTYNQGDMLYASAANTLSALAKSATVTQYLTNTGSSNSPAWGYVNLANGVTGNLAVTHLNSGTNADATHFWRGDGSWAVPSGSGGTVTSVTASSPLASSGGATPDISLTGIVALANGGTNAALTASNGGLIYSTASALAVLAGTATANQVPLSGSSTTPAWSTATYLPTLVANEIVYASATNTMAQIATANNSVLATDSGGVPGFTLMLPSQVQVSVGSLNNGTSASNTTFWRGDGSWATPPSGGGGAYEFIGVQVASNSPTISFTGLNSNYSAYKVVAFNITSVVNQTELTLNCSTNNGVSYDTGANYSWYNLNGKCINPGSIGSFGDEGDTSISINGQSNVSNISGQTTNFELTFFSPATNVTQVFEWHGQMFVATNNWFYLAGGASYTGATTVNALQFAVNSGNIATGTFYLYGIRNS